MIQPVNLLISNSVAQASGLTRQALDALRYDLSYQAEDPIPGGWNGRKSLMDMRGVFQTGLVPRVCRLLAKYGLPYEIADQRTKPEPELPLFSPGLRGSRDYQERLVSDALRLGRGVIASPPRSGKTWMGALIFDKNPLKSIWVAPTLGIVSQTVEFLRERLSLPENEILTLVGGATPYDKKMAMRARLVVATAATAVKLSKRFYDTCHNLFIDEYHHAAADTYHKISLLASSVYHRYGLTGTHFRSYQNDEIRMEAVLSDVIGRVDVSTLIARGYLAAADVFFIPIEAPRVLVSNALHAYEPAIVKHEVRNRWIAWAAQTLANSGRPTVVLVGWKDHGAILAEMIPGSVSVNGDDPAGVKAAIKAFNAGRIPVLIGTSSIGEGIDLPAASGLVYAKSGHARVTVTQDYYRVLTAHEGKGRAVIVDFADRHSRPQLRHSMNRAKIYAMVPEFGISMLDMADPYSLVRRTSVQ